MKGIKKLVCLMLSFILLWNSTSYLAEAQGIDNDGIKTEGSDITDEKEDEPKELGDQQEIQQEVKMLNQLNDLNDEDLQDEDPQDGLQEELKDGPEEKTEEQPKDIVPEDVFGDEEFIANIETALDKTSRSITLQWEKVMDYDGLEVVIYKKIDRSDANPVIVDLVEKSLIEDIPNEDTEVKAQKVVLDKDVLKETIAEGSVYYIDLRAYTVEGVESAEDEKIEEPDENEDDTEDDTEAVDVDELEEKLTYKKYGKVLNSVAVFLAVPTLTVKAGDAQCVISWTAVKGATKYELLDSSTGKVIKTLAANKFTVSKLKNSVKYSYQVRAIAELKAVADAEVVTSFVSDWSAKSAGTTKIVKPATVSGLTITPYNLGAILKWNKVSGATQYEIYRYDNKTKKWKSIKKTTDTTYKNTKLTNKRKYQYKVRAIRTAGGKTAIGGFSSVKKITAKKYLTCSVHPIYYKARVKSTTSLYKESSGSAVAGKIKKGTKVTILKRARGAKGRCYVKINGKGYWINRNKLSFYGGSYTTKDYTTDVKENFVNSNGYTSKTKYLIWLSSYTQKVNIFKGSKGKWKLYKTFKCTTGKPSTSTPQGTYKINKKISRYGNYTYEKYLTCFYGLTSFHSRLYRNGRIVDARIGKPISGGCMRMYTNEAKFIYDKMPKGTTVVSY